VQSLTSSPRNPRQPRNPTVECDVCWSPARWAGPPCFRRVDRSREAIELRDGDKKRYLGKGVLRRSNSQHRDQRAVLGLDASEQAFLDRTLIDLDGTETRAAWRERDARGQHGGGTPAAEESGLPLYRYFGGSGGMQMPVPMMNVINGGAHANNNLDLQELMIIPVGAPSFREAVRYGAEVFHALKKIIDGKGMTTAVGDRRRFAPNVASHEAPSR